MTSETGLEDAVWVAMSKDGALRARVVRADVTCKDAVSRHTLSPLAAHALSRALVCVSLVPIADKHDRTVSLHFTGGGALQSVFVEARPSADDAQGVLVRGNVRVPDATGWAIDPRGRAIGRALVPGVLRLLRQAPDASVQHGEVELVSGELDEDLEHLFRTSEQVATRVHAVVALDAEGGVTSARGLLVQALPGADPARLATLDAAFALQADSSPEQWLRAALGDNAQVLEKLPLHYGCPCSKERALGGVSLLDRDEIIDIIVREHGTEVRCQMCGKVYRLTPEDLLPIVEMKDNAGPGSA